MQLQNLNILEKTYSNTNTLLFMEEITFMKHECKITVLETKVFPELQEKYLADPKSCPCPFFKAGDTFTLKRTPERDDFYHMMNGRFCGEAWDTISRYVYTALQGGSIMHK